MTLSPCVPLIHNNNIGCTLERSCLHNWIFIKQIIIIYKKKKWEVTNNYQNNIKWKVKSEKWKVKVWLGLHVFGPFGLRECVWVISESIIYFFLQKALACGLACPDPPLARRACRLNGTDLNGSWISNSSPT